MSSKSNPFNVPPQGFYFCTSCTTTITWTPTTQGTVTLELMDMSKSDVGTVIANSIANIGHFTFTPPANSKSGTSYMLEIVDDTNPDIRSYSPQFAIVNLKAASSGATMTNGAMPSTMTMSTMSQSTMTMSTMTPGASMTMSATPAPSTHHGLSGGAYAGIGIGAAIVLLGVVALAFFFGRRTMNKRRKSLDESSSDEKGSPPNHDPQEPVTAASPMMSSLASPMLSPVMDPPKIDPMRHISSVSELDAGPRYPNRMSELSGRRDSPEAPEPMVELADTSPTPKTAIPYVNEKKRFHLFA